MLWPQERVAAKHSRVVKVATESNPAAMLTKALGRSKMDELCEEIGQKLTQKPWTRNPRKPRSPKTVKFAVVTNDEMIKNKLNDDDDDTQRSPSNSRWRPGLTGVSVGVITPLLMTVCSTSNIR